MSMEPLVSPEERLGLERRSKYTTTIAFIAVIGVRVVTAQSDSLLLYVLGWAAILGFWALFVWGCADLARSKGYPWQMGLLGLAWLVGYVILYYMRDRWLDAKYTPKPPVADVEIAHD